MADLEELAGKKIGPLPVGGWVLLVGGAGMAAYLVRKNSSSTRTIVDEVPVPVGAVAAPDGAPLVMAPIIRADFPGMEELTAALTGSTSATKSLTDVTRAQTNAVKSNTSAVGSNTSAVKANTSAVKSSTSAVKANTAAVKAAPKAAPVTSKKVATAKKATTKRYTIRSGDTLWDIARRYTGNGNNWTKLYAANKSVIDSTAKRRGKSGGGKWIFPGTTLNLPAGW